MGECTLQDGFTTFPRHVESTRFLDLAVDIAHGVMNGIWN